MRILFVEDNAELARLTTDHLKKDGVAVDHVGGVEDAIAVLDTRSYDAVILDLGLPDGDGLTVLRHLRAASKPLPVLILSARVAVGDRVKGLNQGADDYLPKPFAFEELTARLTALLRRPGALLGVELTLGNVSLDSGNRQVTVGGSALSLSVREAELLELLLRRAGRVVSKEGVENALFGLDDGLGSNAVEVYVHRLRKRLQDAGATPVIHTVRGVGYVIAST